MVFSKYMYQDSHNVWINFFIKSSISPSTKLVDFINTEIFKKQSVFLACFILASWITFLITAYANNICLHCFLLFICGKDLWISKPIWRAFHIPYSQSILSSVLNAVVYCIEVFIKMIPILTRRLVHGVLSRRANNTEKFRFREL